MAYSSPSKDKKARFIAEISKVVYNGKFKVDPDDQLGRIIVRNHKFHHYIYDVDDGDMCKSSIEPGGELTLTGPSLSSITCPSGFLVIDVDLFCGAFEETLRVKWLPSNFDELCHYDEKTIKSKYDKDEEICIHFGMFYRATEALIEVSLLTKDDSVIDLRGSVSAYTGENRNDKSKHSTLLFSNLRVQPEEPIPLSRSIVAVPMDSKLFVNIDLNDNSLKFAGLLNLDAKLDGVDEITRVGTNCEIFAKVTWNSKYDSRGELNEICDYVE